MVSFDIRNRSIDIPSRKMNTQIVKPFKLFKPQSLPQQYMMYKGRQAKCHTNAIMLVMHCPELTYCEGYAKPAIDIDPVEHAWCVTNDGRVVEPTWDNCGVAYFGVSLCFASVCQLMLEADRAEHIEMWKRDHVHVSGQLRLEI